MLGSYFRGLNGMTADLWGVSKNWWWPMRVLWFMAPATLWTLGFAILFGGIGLFLIIWNILD